MCAQRVTRHVLVVDDYPDVAEMLAMLLVDASPMTITTDVGTDGAQALRLAIAHPPAVAVLDIDMPVMNGLDAALAIKTALRGAVPFLIAVTGNPGQAAAMSTHMAFDRVLTKPVDIEMLVDLLANG